MSQFANDLVAIEKLGHELTMVAPMHAGISTYYCEKCGALVTFYQGNMRVFHVPPGSPSKLSQCVEMPIPEGNGTPRKLHEKLDEEVDFFRLQMEND